MTFIANTPSTMPVPIFTTNGAGAIGLQSAGYPLGPSGEYLYPGLIIRGWVTPETSGCTPYCQAMDISFVDDNNNVIFGVQHNTTSAPAPLLIGMTRTASTTAANEGYTLGAVFAGDLVATGSTAEGPMFYMQSDVAGNGGASTPNMVGMGKESTSNSNVFVGSSANNDTPWDDAVGDQIDLDTLGCHGTGIAAGGGFQGTPAIYMTGKLCGLSGGGIEVENAAKTAAAPIMASIYRTTPTTVSGLSTADASPAVGDRAVVTDATACTFNSAVTGGGSTKCPVVYTGSWVAG